MTAARVRSLLAQSLQLHASSALDPEIFCAGIIDRAERLRDAYLEEAHKRNMRE
jgi:hypothetical protein